MSTTTEWRHDTRDGLVEITDTLVELLPEITSVFTNRSGATGRTNASGDTQMVADKQVDEILFDAVADLDTVGEYASEERPEIVDVGSGLAFATDPVDGSSNITANTTVGTIIGVYDAALPAAGRDLIGSICIVFGPLTTLSVAADGELIEHIVQNGEIVGSEPVELPEEGGICGFSGRPNERPAALREYETELRTELKLRYSGAMIADVWQLLAHGGLIGYPETDSKPGVLRLQYESNPVAYAVEAAGGAASTGRQRILDVEPADIHQRLPTYFGTQSRIEELETRFSDHE